MKILIRDDENKNWKIVDSAAYDNESELQKLLADSPDLIPVNDLREGIRQLVAVVREFSVAIGAIDILGVTADGNIAVIECKLAKNPEVKRKVIGQVLEYGSALWGMSYEEFDEKIQSKVGVPLAEFVQNAVDDSDWDEEFFRSNIEENLLSGNFILMIVVDEINEALSRIIRFLNACGNPQFSFAALEMRRFQKGNTEILLPKVSVYYNPYSKRKTAERKTWDEDSFFKDAKERVDEDIIGLMRDLFEFSQANAPGGVDFGSGKDKGSFTYYVLRYESRASIFSVYSNGDISVNLGAMQKVFSNEEIDEFAHQVAKIPALEGLEESDKYWNTYKLGHDIEDKDQLDYFKESVLRLNGLL